MRTRSWARTSSPRFTLNPAADLHRAMSESSSLSSSLTPETATLAPHDGLASTLDAATPRTLLDRPATTDRPISGHDAPFSRNKFGDHEQGRHSAWTWQSQAVSTSVRASASPDAMQPPALKRRNLDVYLSNDPTEHGGDGPSGSFHLGDSDGNRDASRSTSVAATSIAGTLSPRGRSQLTHPSEASSSHDKGKAKDGDEDEYEESSSESEPGRRKTSAAFRPRGRKKRNKCSPEQLESLEAFFAKNRNPTGKVREELSKRLRMPERSVQVWFQNRRAKVKTLERRGMDPASYTPPSRRKQADVRSDEAPKESTASTEAKTKTTSKTPTTTASRSATRVIEKQPVQTSVTALPTTALCIGSWRRIAPLVCFFSRRLQMLSWYLNSDAVGFKLEMSWTSIKSCVFDGPTQPTLAERQEGIRQPLGHFLVELTAPPTFFMEVFRSVDPGAGGENKARKTSWRQCADFTEGQQATKHRVHLLSGPYDELRRAVVEFTKSNQALEKLVRFRDAERFESSGDAAATVDESADPLSSALQHIGADLRTADVSAFDSYEGGTSSALQTTPSRGIAADWAAAQATDWQDHQLPPISNEGRPAWSLQHQGSPLDTLPAITEQAGAYTGYPNPGSSSLSTSEGYHALHEAHARHLPSPHQGFGHGAANALQLDTSAATSTSTQAEASQLAYAGATVEQHHVSAVGFPAPAPAWAPLQVAPDRQPQPAAGMRWTPQLEPQAQEQPVSFPAYSSQANGHGYPDRHHLYQHHQPQQHQHQQHQQHIEAPQHNFDSPEAAHRRYRSTLQDYRSSELDHQTDPARYSLAAARHFQDTASDSAPLYPPNTSSSATTTAYAGETWRREGPASAQYDQANDGRFAYERPSTGGDEAQMHRPQFLSSLQR
ncbi:uncharacterized protein PFL1_02807 [Pseudozyma flocculosa PF-1]|uniref:Homeobox domain-containing protein n=2 Tax=Pseudozyma flocculosa TaxID=84751 RepID=A0A5C3F384_9BASI|nr:uncharacterized protein PFL1_02807 [Pseudozyma flocculosa PF-1]EPQ29588.1 hypothetical protein PFL1_02807 [Pseudozyma flocculosa PF-1]SPO38137.1 uncharacterized protein PSFLO_03614 [Pseudozyma flocculosa]